MEQNIHIWRSDDRYRIFPFKNLSNELIDDVAKKNVTAFTDFVSEQVHEFGDHHFLGRSVV